MIVGEPSHARERRGPVVCEINVNSRRPVMRAVRWRSMYFQMKLFRKFRLTLSLLFIVLSATAVFFSYFSSKVRINRSVLRIAEEKHGFVAFDHEIAEIPQIVERKGNRTTIFSLFRNRRKGGNAWLPPEFTGEIVALQFLSSKLTDNEIETLCRLRNLQELTVTSANITGFAVEQVSQLPHLRKLVLLQTKLTDQDIDSLSRLSDLEVLEIESTELTDAAADTFSSMQSLRSLTISGANITHQTEKTLERLLPDLLHFSVN